MPRMPRIIVLFAALSLLTACNRDVGERTTDTHSETDTVADAAPDTAPPDADSTDTNSPDTEPSDTRSPDTDAGPDTRPDCQTDTDGDGLTDCEEEHLCTDPEKADTDGDGLDDLEEFQKMAPDPCKADTDGDGLEDGREERLGFDPDNRDTDGDGTIDGDEWIVDACTTTSPAPVDLHESQPGNWTVALSPAFSNYTELQISDAGPADAAAIYGDSSTEVAGFLLSRATRSTTTSPVDPQKNDLLAAVESAGTVTNDLLGSEFTTVDGSKAARATYTVDTDAAMTSAELRTDLLFDVAPFSASDASGLPSPSGADHDEFHVEITAIVRPSNTGQQSRTLVAVVVAPQSEYASTDQIQFQVGDLTNATHIVERGRTAVAKCDTTARPVRRGEIGGPDVLAHTPISSSLDVWLDGQDLPRSRTDGFNYQASNDALVYFGKYRRGRFAPTRRVHRVARYKTFER
jgi:hypothetical protein